MKISGGAKWGLGRLKPTSEHAVFRRKVKNYDFTGFWQLQYPRNCILAPSSEVSALRRKILGAIPDEI